MEERHNAASKTCTTCKTLKSIELFSPDKRASDGRQSRCRDCASAKRRERYHANPEAARERQRRYWLDNPEIAKAIHARTRAKNADKIKARKKLAYERDKVTPEFARKRKAYAERVKDKKREYDRCYRSQNAQKLADLKMIWRAANTDLVKSIKSSWKRRNPHKVTADTRKRQATQLRATPPWADHRAIDQYYLIAGFLSAELGVDFHVDHIVPLRSGIVQGFHSQNNLNISIGAWNSVKGNRWWPDMPHRVDVGMIETT